MKRRMLPTSQELIATDRGQDAEVFASFALWTGYSRKPGCSWFPAGQPRAGLWVEDGLAETLALQATRINGGCRHQTIAHPPTVG